jgi:hypothetical protein
MNSDEILSGLLAGLWSHYKSRVPYARSYERLVREHGGKVVNDHIAFRTFNAPTGDQPPGVEAIARVFTPLGYVQKDMYVFEDKMLTAWHYEHARDATRPKLFISQMEVAKAPAGTAKLIRQAVADAHDLLAPAARARLVALGKGETIEEAEALPLIRSIARFFVRPWRPPPRAIIEPVNKESQYAAWTLLHGNAVNHFTASINNQNVKAWPDLETTVKALREAGLPMKPEIEGERGSKLVQSSTQAAEVEVEVTEEEGQTGKMPWSYAYYELAERNMAPGPDGKPALFQGFLGAQATNLFEMTKRK